MKRRKFLQNASLTGIGLTTGTSLLSNNLKKKSIDEILEAPINSTGTIPLVIATWNVPNATNKAGELIDSGKSSLDAIEQGCMIEEANEKGQSVGKGGLPDRDGNVTLDACIMNKEGNYGAVVYMQNINAI